MRLEELFRLIVRGGPTSPDSRLRFQFYSVFVALGAPNFVLFGTLAFVQRNIPLGLLVIVAGTTLVAGWIRLGAGHDDKWIYRVNAVTYGLLLLAMVAMGGDAGSKSLWVLTYPMVAAFLFGEREGAAWGLGMLAGMGLLFGLSGPVDGVYDYQAPFFVRLMAVYLFVLVITVAFEYHRRVYRDGMILEQQRLEIEKQLLRQQMAERERAEREKAALIVELQDTLAQVKTLKGLVPICANCHRIRDDRGFWNQLEFYLRQHSDAEFSHGICPSCIAALYPDFEEPSR